MTTSGVPVSCKCGNQFKVKEAAIGRKVRCPECKTPCLVAMPIEVPDPKPESLPEITQVEPPVTFAPEINEAPQLSASPYASPAYEPQPTTSAAGFSTSIPPEKNYKHLLLVSWIYGLLARLVIAIWLIAMVVGLIIGIYWAATSSDPGSNFFGLLVGGSVQLLISGLTASWAALLLFAMSEGIVLAIDIQRNTYQSAYRR